MGKQPTTAPKPPTYDEVEKGLREMQARDPARYDKLRADMGKSFDKSREARNARYASGMMQDMQVGPNVAAGQFGAQTSNEMLNNSAQYYKNQGDANVGAPLDDRSLHGLALQLMKADPTILHTLLQSVDNSPQAIDHTMRAQ